MGRLEQRLRALESAGVARIVAIAEGAAEWLRYVSDADLDELLALLEPAAAGGGAAARVPIPDVRRILQRTVDAIRAAAGATVSPDAERLRALADELEQELLAATAGHE